MIRVLAVALILAAALSVPGGAQNGDGIIRIFAVTSSLRVVDVGKPGPSAGDERIAGMVLYDRQDRIIGNGYRVCENLGRALPSAASFCHAIYALPRGKLVCEGTRQRRDYYVLPVIGGTRLYSTVQGTLIAATISDNPRRERLLFSLES